MLNAPARNPLELNKFRNSLAGVPTGVVASSELNVFN